MADPSVKELSIPGLYEIDLVLHGDSRGWFKENYQQSKLLALGLPEIAIVQNNISFNNDIGVTRGLHAEPWEKYVSLASGEAFAAWVDLRKGPTFGKVCSVKLTPDKAIFVPRGVANGYQTTTENVTYTYLVNKHWSPEAKYTYVNLFDPELKIAWPISRTDVICSDKDLSHPFLADVIPMEV